jgi:hypothetical protein
MSCAVCTKPYYYIRQDDYEPTALYTEKMCLCHSDIYYGWVCKDCGELWYPSDERCDCGGVKTDRVIHFVDHEIQSTRSTLRNIWVSLRNIF